MVEPPATSSAGVLNSTNTTGVNQTNTSSTTDVLVSEPTIDLHSFYHVQFSSLMVLAGATITVRTLWSDRDPMHRAPRITARPLYLRTQVNGSITDDGYSVFVLAMSAC